MEQESDSGSSEEGTGRRTSQQWHRKLCSCRKTMLNLTFQYFRMFGLNILLISVLLNCLSPVSAQILDRLDYQILEESPSDFMVGNVSRDAKFSDLYPDSDISILEFSLSAAQIGTRPVNFQDFFFIEKTYGVIRTSQQIDRDKICSNNDLVCKISVKIIVQPHQYFHIIRMTVTILDQNDNSPRFVEDKITLTVAETQTLGAAFTMPLAEDADSRVYGVHHYELDPPSDHFSLRTTNSSGVISDLHLILTSKLDHEQNDFYRLKIYAIDGGLPPRSGSTFIEITVLDTNDNNPTFDRTDYEIKVPEDIPVDVIIIKVHAVDPDQGIFGDILYSFAPTTIQDFGDTFGIRDLTGEIYLKKQIDYEENQEYELSVMAQDRGENSLPAYANVLVTVEDVNDHSPEILMNSLSVSGHAEVQEGMKVGTFVTHLLVSDPDGGENGQAHCQMISSYFKLDDINGDGTEFYIVTNKVFDREVLDHYEVTVSCSDGGTPARTTSLKIPVTILDANDHLPVFWKPIFRADIKENTEVDTLIIRVNASDEDIGRNSAIKYELLNEEDKKLIHVDPTTGKISTKVSFDYEKEDKYLFTLIAYDQGIPIEHTATATLSLSITDVNDIPPTFLNASYQFRIRENQAADTVLGFLEAEDGDKKEEFSVITYMWDPAILVPIPFIIEEKSGKVIAQNSLDREEREIYELVAIAANEGFPGMSSSVFVVITILDVNDNAPIIFFPGEYNNTIQVAKDTEVGEVIAQIEALDLDRDQNGRLTYFMEGGNDTFEIDAETGKVIVTDDLEELGHDSCKLLIKVKDSGSPPRSTVADLNIMIKKSIAPALPRSSFGALSGVKLIIFLIIFAFIIIVIIILGIIFTMRRKNGGRKDKRQIIIRESDKQNNLNYNDRVDSKYIINDEDDDYEDGRPNGEAIEMADGRIDRPKKEVKFVMDMGHVGESSTDDSQLPWPPSDLDNGMIGTPRSRSYGSLGSPAHSPELPKTSTPEEQDKLGPLWIQPWHYSQYPPPPPPAPQPQKYPPPPPPPGRGGLSQHSPITPLTEMELEMHEMLQILGKDKDSETGSVTDSGRGPSEEGDARPSPLDPNLSGDSAHNLGRSGQGLPTTTDAGGCRVDVPPTTDNKAGSHQPRRLCALPKTTVPPPTNKSYCFHEHKSGGCGAGGQCPLKPNRTITSSLHPPINRHHRRSVNFSTDSSDSGVSWPESNCSNQGNRRGSQGNNDQKRGPTVKFQDGMGPGDTRSLDRPSKGPMSKFCYNQNQNGYQGDNERKHSLENNGCYSNHDRIAENDPYETRLLGICSDNNQNEISLNSEGENGQSKSENCSNTTRLKGILKNADEPIRRCINDNIDKYNHPQQSWSGKSQSTGDNISDDGNASIATTMSGSYVLDSEDLSKDTNTTTSSPPDPKLGFMV